MTDGNLLFPLLCNAIYDFSFGFSSFTGEAPDVCAERYLKDIFYNNKNPSLGNSSLPVLRIVTLNEQAAVVCGLSSRVDENFKESRARGARVKLPEVIQCYRVLAPTFREKMLLSGTVGNSSETRP